jgi:hypothetical protein
LNQPVVGREDRSVDRPRRLTSSWRLAPPSIPALVFAVLALFVPILLQKPMLNSDGDLARHLRHGHYMLEHGELIRADPFSFTRPGAPFVAFEYGSQVLYALAERVGSLAGVAVLAGLLIAITYALLTRFLLARGVDPLLACVITAFAIALGVNHWTARPHLFSFVAVMVLMSLLEGGRGQRRHLLACAALFGLWANIHGGFVYGWILIGLYLAGSLGELVWGDDRAAWRERVRYYGAMLAISAPVTLLNPHGFELHRHLVGFFGKPFLRDNTAEFASPDFHAGDGKVFLAVLLLGLVSLALHRRRPTLPRLLLICVGVTFALIANRNIPLFGLTALPVLALHLDDLWRRLPDPRGVRGRFESTAGLTVTLPWALPAGALLAVLFVTGGRIGSLQLVRNDFDETVFPVAAVAYARNAQLKGRLFSEFAWGGYLVYAWPEQKVFIDGGTDFFGEALYREFSKIKQMAPGWRHLLNKWDISLMLLQRQSPLAHESARDLSWILRYCDSLATIFQRSPATLSVTAAATDSAEHVLDSCGSRSPSHAHGNPRE